MEGLMHPLYYEGKLFDWVPSGVRDKIHAFMGSANANVPKIRLEVLGKIVDFCELEQTCKMNELPKPLGKKDLDLSAVVGDKFANLVVFSPDKGWGWGIKDLQEEMGLVVELIAITESLGMESLVDLSCAKCASIVMKGDCTSLDQLSEVLINHRFKRHIQKKSNPFASKRCFPRSEIGYVEEDFLHPF